MSWFSNALHSAQKAASGVVDNATKSLSSAEKAAKQFQNWTTHNAVAKGVTDVAHAANLPAVMLERGGAYLANEVVHSKGTREFLHHTEDTRQSAIRGAPVLAEGVAAAATGGGALAVAGVALGAFGKNVAANAAEEAKAKQQAQDSAAAAAASSSSSSSSASSSSSSAPHPTFFRWLLEELHLSRRA